MYEIIQKTSTQTFYWTGSEFNLNKELAAKYEDEESAYGEAEQAAEWAEVNKAAGDISVVEGM